MTAPRKSYDQLRSEARRALETGGVITNLNDGGVARQILDIGALQIADLYDAQSFQALQGRLSTASGVYLDLIGQSRGLTRGSETVAIVSQEDEIIQFFSIDGKAPIRNLLPGAKVASGTLVTSLTGDIEYEVSADVYPDDVQTEIFVPAVSLETGTAQNIGKGVLVSHNLGVTEVGVVNVEAIATGQDTESDSNYRFRISRALSQAAGATEDAIRIAAFSFPGVSSVTIRPFSDGVGTLEVLIVPVGNRISPEVLRAIEARVRRSVAAGTRLRVATPATLPVRLTIELSFRSEVSSVQRARSRDLARQAILAYLAELPIGGVFVVNELIQRVMGSSDNILDMRVLLYNFRHENQALRNVRAEADELFAPDPEAQNAIRVL